MKNYLIFLFFLFFAVGVRADQGILLNSGFITKPIWFSSEPVFANEDVRVYTALHNNTEYDITGVVSFFDNKNLISQVDFTLGKGIAMREVWVDWLAVQGEHDISAKITNAKASKAGSQPVALEFDSAAAISINKYIDKDSDKDGKGDIEDMDDDNDGISDVDEMKLGLNPFKWDDKSKFATSAALLEAKTTTTIEKIESSAFVDKISKYVPVIPILSQAERLNNLLDEQTLALEKKKNELSDYNSTTDAERSLSQLNIEREEMRRKEAAKDFIMENAGAIKSLQSASTTKMMASSSSVIADRAKEEASKGYQWFYNRYVKYWWNQLLIYLLTVAVFFLKYNFLLFFTIIFFVYLLLRKIVRLFLRRRDE